MDATVRELVRRRAGNRCEYCLLKQAHLPFSRFQVEHITIVGLTAVGRTTVRVRNMNEERRVRLRAVLKRYGHL